RDLGRGRGGRGFRGRRANRGRLGRLVARGGRLGSGLAVRRRAGHPGGGGGGRGFRGRRASRGRLGRLVARGGRLGSGLAVRRRLGHRGAVGGRDRSGIVGAAMPGVRGAVSRRLLHVGRTVVSRFLFLAALRGG